MEEFSIAIPGRRRSIILAVLTILIFGAARVPFESTLAAEHRAAYFHGAQLNLDLREKIGQLGFLAALSGFRSLVADFLWIQAYNDWTRTEWGKMLLIFNNVTALQPRDIMFWDMSAWHMAYNASVAARDDITQPREALRIKHQREYIAIGIDFLERGIQNIPDHAQLYQDLAQIQRDKLQDHCAAAVNYAKAAAAPDAPAYVHRFAAYEFSFCPGHERQAYEQLLSFYKRGENEWLPTLLSRLQYLEEKLNIPAAQRVYIPKNGLPPAHRPPPP